MTLVTCRLTAKNRDQLRNPTLGNVIEYGLPFPLLFIPVGEGVMSVMSASVGLSLCHQISLHVADGRVSVIR